MLANGSQILSGLLFDSRSSLATLKGVSDLVQQEQVQFPDDVVAWLNKWRPTYQAWYAEEKRFRAYCNDPQETSLDWKKLIAEFGESLEPVTVVWSEAQMLTMPKEHEAEWLVGAAIQAVDHLNKLYHLITSGEYKQYWNNTSS